MSDIPFAIGVSIPGNEIRCPNLKKSKFEPAALEYQYLNGSLVYIGGSSVTYVWDYLTNEEVATIRDVYNFLLNGFNHLGEYGQPIYVTVPDFRVGGWRVVSAYMTEPSGAAGGDLTRDLSVTFYNLLEDSLKSKIDTVIPMENLWDAITLGQNIIIGLSGYEDTGWQF
jgi:hypothetical protein